MQSEIVAYDERYRDGLVAAVQAVYEEYGFAWEADGYHRDLFTVEESYLRAGGMFWVLVEGGEVTGTIGAINRGGGVVEGERLYLRHEARGRGDGERMLRCLIDWSRGQGFERLIGWSDKRFDAAHQLYAKLGFVQRGERICDDPEQSPEWGFELTL